MDNKLANKTIFIRADASVEMGTGHVMRCLTLAEALRDYGAAVFFICRDLPGNLCCFIKKKGFKVYTLDNHGAEEQLVPGGEYATWLGVDWQTDAQQTQAVLRTCGAASDWLIVDHYALNRDWEISLRPYTKKIMVIDDLANRHHDCDLLLDQNLYDNMKQRYEGLLPDYCQVMLGPRYAMLRSEFLIARQKLRRCGDRLSRILVFFGGSDPTNETQKVLEAINVLNCSDRIFDIVVGATNPYKYDIQKVCRQMPSVNYHCQVNYMAELMAKADLAIGAGGSVTWERCCLGLPALVTILADNQYKLTRAVERHGAIINMGFRNCITPADYAEAVGRLTPSQLRQMSLQGLKLVDGEGCARVAEKICSG